MLPKAILGPFAFKIIIIIGALAPDSWRVDLSISEFTEFTVNQKDTFVIDTLIMIEKAC